jgi:hypothetical protein
VFAGGMFTDGFAGNLEFNILVQDCFVDLFNFFFGQTINCLVHASLSLKRLALEFVRQFIAGSFHAWASCSVSLVFKVCSNLASDSRISAGFFHI